MKKFVLICCVLIYAFMGVILVSKLKLDTPASTESLYAKITTNNCPLFKTITKNNHYSNIYFLLEESYYVQIINEQSDFYYVNYLDFQGYVSKECVTLVNETPKKPYLQNINFTLTEDCYIYSEPNNLEEQKIEKLNKNSTLTYIGKIYANEIVNYGGDLWYFAKITNNNKDIYGYIYSNYATNLTSINKNDEIYTEYIAKTTSNILYLNNTTQNMIILLISIPTLIIIILFLKGFKKV